MANQAALIPEKHAPLVVKDVEVPTPGDGDILVKVEAIAFSPIEYKLQKYGVRPISYPNNLGLSYAGTVQGLGPNVTNVKVGDRLAIMRPGETMDDPRFGSFQKFALAKAKDTAKLSPNTSFEAGAAIILNLISIVSALSIHLGMDRPPLDGPANSNGKKVLIYGGSSSCGNLAIKYATAAGYKVVTTSSPLNKEYVQSLGPESVIDHTAPAEAIREEIHHHGPYDHILDTIGVPSVTNIIVPYLASVGGGAYNALIPTLGSENPIPDNVHRRFAAHGWDFDKEENYEFGRWLFEQYFPRGLDSGLIPPTRHHVVEGGLANAQHALDLMERGGVSGHKLIMYP